MRSVALFGQMASGKSTISSALVDSGYAQMAFAQPLKNIAELAYGKIDKSGEYSVTTLDGKVEIISGREVLQRVGQSIKSHDRDFWLRCFFNSARHYLDTPLVVDDGRFLFERDALADNDWLIVGIQTPESVRRQRYLTLYGRYPTASELSHQSEVELPEIINSAPIILDGTQDPYLNVKQILQEASQ